MKQFLLKEKAATITWVIYLIITFIAVLFHEPNRDEAQAWLIVRDLDIGEIFSQLSVKGHPGLWYLIILPFAKLGFPYLTMHLIHWLIMAIAVGIFLVKAPINFYTKLFFVFSYYILFEYTIIARNYGLTVLILFLIAAFYNYRFTSPYKYALLILLLLNCNVHSIGAGIALLIVYIAEVKKEGLISKLKFPILIIVAGLIASIIQLIPSAHLSHDVTIHADYLPLLNINSIWVTTTGIQNAFIPITPEYEELKVALFFTFVFILFLFNFYKTKQVFTFLLISSLWLFYIFSTKLSGSWRHEGLLLVFIVFSIWINSCYQNNNRQEELRFKIDNFLKIFLTLALCINTIFGLNTIKKEIQNNFSGTKELANFIINNHLENNEIACYRSWRASGISPYLPKTHLWFIDRQEYGTYFILDDVFQKKGDSLTEEEVLSITKSKYKEVLLLLNEPLLKLNDSSFNSVLLFNNKKMIWGTDDEIFYLYKIKFN